MTWTRVALGLSTIVAAAGAFLLALGVLTGAWVAAVAAITMAASVCLGVEAIVGDANLGRLRRDHDGLRRDHDNLADDQYYSTPDGQAASLLAAMTETPVPPRPREP